MVNFSAADVKKLREDTGAGYMACKEALSHSDGDRDKAAVFLREKGVSIAKKKSARLAQEGLIGSYIHADGKIGVLVEINCETDFAAGTDAFKDFVKDIAMHIAAINPTYIRREEIPQKVVEAEQSIYIKQVESEGKPAHIADRIVKGKIEKFIAQSCLLEQKYYRDSDFTVKDILNQCIARIGENITIERFIRFETGEK